MDENPPSRDCGDTYAPRADWMLPAGEWDRLLANETGPLASVLEENYGDEPEVLKARRSLYRAVLSRFVDLHGPARPVYLIASPCRINWEGHHVDHQGGNYNSTTHAREVVAVCAPREDDKAAVANLQGDRFPSVEISLSDTEPLGGAGRWADYVKGGFLAVGRRLGRAPRGADLVIGGDIPVGAGLSSSHALVLCSVLSALAASEEELGKRAAVASVQEGEWFTGSRTGLGDQAAMIFGRRGQLFFGRVLVADEIAPRYAPLPPDIRRVMINSYAEHSLHGKERLAYSSRVFAYRMAFPLLMAAVEACEPPRRDLESVRCLADISPRHFPTEMIYRALRSIPEELSLEEVGRRIKARPYGTDLGDLVRTYLGAEEPPPSIRIRGIALYGLAECQRSVLFGPLLQEGRLQEAAELVTIGHTGDRVVERDTSGAYRPVSSRVNDAYLDRLIADRLSGDPNRVGRAALSLQPGEYRASIQELDELVDIALDAGAACASLTGGGLGGVVIAFVERSRMARLREMVGRHYAREEKAEVEWITKSAEFAEYFSSAEHSEIASMIEASARRKRAALASGEPWAPSAAEMPLFDRIRTRLEEWEKGADAAPSRRLQYLPADWVAEGVQQNVSVAGAGYLPPPGP